VVRSPLTRRGGTLRRASRLSLMADQRPDAPHRPRVHRPSAPPRGIGSDPIDRCLLGRRQPSRSAPSAFRPGPSASAVRPAGPPRNAGSPGTYGELLRRSWRFTVAISRTAPRRCPRRLVMLPLFAHAGEPCDPLAVRGRGRPRGVRGERIFIDARNGRVTAAAMLKIGAARLAGSASSASPEWAITAVRRGTVRGNRRCAPGLAHLRGIAWPNETRS
jgi:hypothetical protein